MKKTLAILAVFLTAIMPVRADEGMWLPLLISQRIEDMQAKGFKLSAEDIYSVNKASLKDAVLRFGGGCTGELISDEGLLLTNHHCGYGHIQRLSSVEHDYLKDGFWAMNKSEELPCVGLSVSFLDYMEDVTDQVLKDYKEKMTEEQRQELVNKNSKVIIENATKNAGPGIRASVNAMYYGNQYFLFVYRTFNDVRFVGAPPSSIGKFGGDTDNWMWPRHTGDFSMFRIYADKNNNPASYSEDNVPYTPKKSFKISRAGVKEGDFTFIYGFPGTTKEYITSDEVSYIAEVSDPAKIAIRTARLEIMNKYQAQSQKVRIQYSAKNQNVSNAWKKWQGEAIGVKKMKTVAQKAEYEKAFAAWAKGTRYAGVLEKLHALYEKRNPYNIASEYYSETVRTIEMLSLASMVKRSLTSKQRLASVVESFYKDYYQPIDEEIFDAVMDFFDKGVPENFKPAYFKEKMVQYGSVQAWRKDLFSKSIFTDKERVMNLTPQDSMLVNQDPAIEMAEAFSDWYNTTLRPVVEECNTAITLAYRTYMKGQMEFSKNKAFYPDANSTLRVAYGRVEGYSPADGVYYKPVSTLTGIIEKDNPDIFDYNIPQVLRDYYAAGGHEKQPVCFLATNHTTGGNSGSPVINANGDLIGINFDRVWEGTMSDIAFGPDFCRNIQLDIRYVLFCIENIGHANWLFNEMRFVD